MLPQLDKYVDVIIKLNITPLQILFLQILHEKRYDLLYKIANEGHYFEPAMIDDLEDKELVVNCNRSSKSMYADYYEVTDKFIELFYEATMRNAEEFWDTYPGYITINNKKIPAKGVNKEEFMKQYHQHITSNDKHELVIASLRFAVDNKLIAIRIDKWLQSEAYNDVIKMMEMKASEDMPNDRLIL